MPKQKPVVLKGTLEAFFEQGSECVVWSFNEDSKTGYDGLHCLTKGDFLRVFNDASKKEVIFEGKISYKFADTPFKPGRQKGQDPKVWAKMFYQAKPAELIVGKQKTP